MNRLITLLIVWFTIIGCRQKSFDSNKWKDNNELQYWMLDDLIGSEILIGKSKNEIIDLLDTLNIKNYNYFNDDWMFIILKPQPSSGTQSPVEVLDLTFENDTTIKVEKRK